MYGINYIFSFLSIIIISEMKNKVNKKRGVKFFQGRVREGRNNIFSKPQNRKMAEGVGLEPTSQ